MSPRRRSKSAALALVVVCLSLPLACGDRPVDSPPAESETARPHVVLISLDTTRADFFGFMGNPWIRTPRFDALAARSVVFEEHESVAPTTLASHTTILSGKFPHNHGTPRNGFMVNRENEMLAETLARAGYRTAGFAGSFALASRFDFAQGFDDYDERYEIESGTQHADQSQRDARAVTDAVMEYLDRWSHEGAREPLFLFIHYFDPHRPYLDHESFVELYATQEIPIEIGSDVGPEWQSKRAWAQGQARRYAAEVSYMDHHVGRLLLDLEVRGLMDDAIVIVTSDHGENFLEHPQIFNHGLTVYGTSMRALWTLALPGREAAGTRVRELTSSIDLLPTLLRELSLPIPDDVDGRVVDFRSPGTLPGSSPSSSPGQMEASDDHAIFSQATKPTQAITEGSGWPNQEKSRSIRRGRYRFIQTPYRETEELYALDRDPLELTNLLAVPNPAPEHIEAANALRRELEAWAAGASPLDSRFDPDDEAETIRRLKSLGYLEDQ